MHAPTTATATAIALVAVGCGSTSASQPPPAVLRAVSSISDGATLTNALPWTAVVAGVAAGDRIERVEFLIDGRRRWIEHRRPYVFNDDHNALDPWILGRGSHSLAVRVVTSRGARASASAQVSVATTAAVPAALAGVWTRRVTAADFDRTHARRGQVPPTGAWHVRFARNGVAALEDRSGSGQTEAFIATPDGRVTFAGPVNWLSPEGRRGGFCEPAPSAAYRWQEHASTLTLTTRHDSRCPDRDAVLGGTWKRE
jgi:hypothetical protein